MKLREAARWINPAILLGAIVFAVAALAITLVLLWTTRQGTTPTNPTPAILSIIPAPSDTPVPPTLTPTIQVTSSLPVLPSQSPGSIGLGGYVQIIGTGGEGLRLRDAPGLNGKILVLGAETEVFSVTKGPVEADEFTWWYLISPYDEDRSGWAVSNYLVPVQAP